MADVLCLALTNWIIIIIIPYDLLHLLISSLPLFPSSLPLLSSSSLPLYPSLVRSSSTYPLNPHIYPDPKPIPSLHPPPPLPCSPVAVALSSSSSSSQLALNPPPPPRGLPPSQKKSSVYLPHLPPPVGRNLYSTLPHLSLLLVGKKEALPDLALTVTVTPTLNSDPLSTLLRIKSPNPGNQPSPPRKA